MVLPQIAYRMTTTVAPRCLWKFAWSLGVKGMLSVERFKARARQGIIFPPFLHLSVINSCNLRCQGCWVDVAAPREMVPLHELDAIVRDAKAHGNAFFGLLGGEPFLHPQLLDLLAAHRDCYFQIFTNGQLITPEIAQRLRGLANATPLVSIEGDASVSDVRRGSRNVLDRSLRGLNACLDAGLVTGVASSLCRSNLDTLLTEDWLRRLIDLGVHYAWFHGYRPVGPDATPELALSPDDLVRVRRFVVEQRAKQPIVIVDAYYDGEGSALCPMATGLTHHVGPSGGIEPCPIIQLAVENVGGGSFYDKVTQSAFLADMRQAAAGHSRGCVVLENPRLVLEIADRHGARDTTQRGTAREELLAMTPRSSQDLPGREIPEKHWMYRFAKRYWFNDFGVYRAAEEIAQR
ncbi:MAG: radical SAM protein [Planctomycetota bacterium]|nr:radical SAM protein [Planctomycetota bacterium]